MKPLDLLVQLLEKKATQESLKEAEELKAKRRTAAEVDATAREEALQEVREIAIGERAKKKKKKEVAGSRRVVAGGKDDDWLSGVGGSSGGGGGGKKKKSKGKKRRKGKGTSGSSGGSSGGSNSGSCGGGGGNGVAGTAPLVSAVAAVRIDDVEEDEEEDEVEVVDAGAGAGGDSRRRSEGGEECAVCLTELDGEYDDVPTTLQCGHRFHGSCLDLWAGKCGERQWETTCPMCRSIMFR